MLISGRHVLLLIALMIASVGAVGAIKHHGEWLNTLVIVLAMANLIALLIFRPGGNPRLGRRRETDDMKTLTPDRRRELIRGTSLYLRELNYRYSIRLDPTETGEHRCFTAEVNGVKLGFVPVLITDNSNDRQGYGYVAFVHDGKRWRGPGLPCPSGQVEAVRHAAKCVSPLATEEETRF
jgi:hypothetical protein